MATENEKISNYMDYMELPLKMVACWQWYPKPDREYKVIINNVYQCFVLFTITNLAVILGVYLYTEWIDIMSSLDNIADSLPLIVSIIIISYYSIYQQELYELIQYMNSNFSYRSARGLTNMTMEKSYDTAKKFARIYTACTMFSVTMYATLPVLVHLWTKNPIQNWFYMDKTRFPFLQFTFVQSLVTQWFVGLAMGQFGVFFAANSILICGQYELLCCSLRNARYTALLQRGVKHAALVAFHSDIQEDEKHNYIYNNAVMVDTNYHYDKRTNNLEGMQTQYDLYDHEHDTATTKALSECARMSQVITRYKDAFEKFVSPLLALRVVQVTLYLCTLLYAATLKFDMMTVEYLAAVALDIFVYCYYGNQIISQASRVTTAAYQCAWPTMGVAPRRVLLNIMLANKRPVVIRAGNFLPMDLHTFVVIIKTSFSYYTLLVNVNEKK